MFLRFSSKIWNLLKQLQEWEAHHLHQAPQQVYMVPVDALTQFLCNADELCIKQLKSCSLT
jgi:hypothetical protein